MYKFKQISCHHFVEIDNYAYFSNRSYNGLFQVELDTGKTKFLGNFEDEPLSEYNIHWELFAQENQIYFLPRRGRHVHIYSLKDQSITAIEIRKASETFFRIGEIIIDKTLLTFLPIEKEAPVKRLDLKTLLVSEVTEKETINGIYLSKSRTAFPIPRLLEEYNIPMTNLFSWEQMPNGKLCAFWLMKHHLLWYAPGIQKIEAVPLTVINRNALTIYLQSALQEYLSQSQSLESEPFTLSLYAKMIAHKETLILNEPNTNQLFGKKIWSFLKN